MSNTNKSSVVEKPWTWTKILNRSKASGAPVWTFPHAPLSFCWNDIALPGMYVEQKLRLDDEIKKENDKNSKKSDVYWLSRTISYEGYFVKVQHEKYFYEPDNTPATTEHYTHFIDVERVGFCAKNELSLTPPPSVMKQEGVDKISPNEWRTWFLTKVTGSLSKHPLVRDVIESEKKMQIHLQIGAQVEMVDVNQTSQMRVGQVIDLVGPRVLIKYWDADTMDKTDKFDSWWCHQNSNNVRALGWSKSVGHAISAPNDYNPPELKSPLLLLPRGIHHLDIKARPRWADIDIQVGMKFEVIDPSYASTISSGSVAKVLKYGYFMIQIENKLKKVIPEKKKKYDSKKFVTVTVTANSKDWFCCHITSPIIFPCGFSKANNIELIPPGSPEEDSQNYCDNQKFDWVDYFEKTGTKPLPLLGLQVNEIGHGFVEGHKLEAVDTKSPQLIFAASVSRVVGRLLRIHFDGWSNFCDQWTVVSSLDIFPIGWCQLVNHALHQPPKSAANRKAYYIGS